MDANHREDKVTWQEFFNKFGGTTFSIGNGHYKWVVTVEELYHYFRERMDAEADKCEP